MLLSSDSERIAYHTRSGVWQDCLCFYIWPPSDGDVLGIYYRGVQWEGGAVDGGSII